LSRLKTSAQIEQVKQLLIGRRFSEAIKLCQQLLAANSSFVAIHILQSQAYQQNSEFDKMLESARRAHQLQPQHFSTNVRLIECLIYTGEIAEAISKLDLLHQHISKDPAKLAKASELYLHCSQFSKVAECLQQAVALDANSPQYRFNLASASITLGDFDQAEKLLNGVIKQTPADFDAYYNRSTLRRQTPESNHTEELEHVFQANRTKANDTIALGYALSKEHEDLADYPNSFQYLTRAADSRRRQMRYQVENDVAALRQIAGTFSRDALAEMQASTSTERPIFILGLPRSGTTLLERLLSSHSQVGSLGEVNNFAFSLIHTVGPNNGKTDLIKRSAECNFNLLAGRYSHASKGYGVDGELLIDKTPLNFLYLGLIKLAFPKAKIIHLKRHPLDSCYAIYKTLFRMGYPFSYDLTDLGNYYIAYHRLMTHWREVFPDGFFEVEYETLVRQPEDEARRLIEYCGLPWEAEILDFHSRKAPTATASAAQVRQPVYTSSIGRWKHYSDQLEPLHKQLSAAGIACA